MRAVRLPSLQSRRPLSDDEFVEKTRKRRQDRRVWAWFGLIWLAIAVPCFLYFLWPLAQAVERLPDEIQNLGWAALFAGFFYGGCVGPFMMGALTIVLQGFDLNGFGRGERLLIKYHDLVKRLEPQKDARAEGSERPGA